MHMPSAAKRRQHVHQRGDILTAHHANDLGPPRVTTGMRSLRDVVHRSRKDGTIVLVAEVHAQPLDALRGTPTMDEIGLDNICPSLDFALARAHAFL